MKKTYYFIDKDGQKKKARCSDNDYFWGLALTHKDGTETVIKCSGKKQVIISKYNYLTKYYGKTMDEIKKKRIIAWTDQFTNPKDLRIVGLFAE